MFSRLLGHLQILCKKEIEDNIEQLNLASPILNTLPHLAKASSEIPRCRELSNVCDTAIARLAHIQYLAQILQNLRRGPCKEDLGP